MNSEENGHSVTEDLPFLGGRLEDGKTSISPKVTLVVLSHSISCFAIGLKKDHSNIGRKQWSHVMRDANPSDFARKLPDFGPT